MKNETKKFSFLQTFEKCIFWQSRRKPLHHIMSNGIIYSQHLCFLITNISISDERGIRLEHLSFSPSPSYLRPASRLWFYHLKKNGVKLSQEENGSQNTVWQKKKIMGNILQATPTDETLVPFRPYVELSFQMSDGHFQHLTIWVATFSCKMSTLGFSLPPIFAFHRTAKFRLVTERFARINQLCHAPTIRLCYTVH